MINGKTMTVSRDGERARCGGHDPVIRSGKFTQDTGILPVGLLLTRLLTGILVALQVVTAEVVDTGDGNTKDLAGNLAAFPVQPGSVVVTDGVETFTDDGCGRLTGDAGGSGTVNYRTGAVAVSFNANVANATDVTADYVTAVDGVLDETVDTSASTSGVYIAHGSVSKDALKVGAIAKAAPAAAQLAQLEAAGIYPM